MNPPTKAINKLSLASPPAANQPPEITKSRMMILADENLSIIVIIPSVNKKTLYFRKVLMLGWGYWMCSRK